MSKEAKQTVEEEAATWKWIGHSHQIADTGDYDGCYEITNGNLSFFTKDEDIDEQLTSLCDSLNSLDINFFIDDSDKFVLKAVDDENKRLWKLIEKHGINPFEDTPAELSAAPLPNERTAQWVSDLKDMPNECYAKFYGWIDETEVKFGMLKYLNKKYYRAVGHGFSFDIDKSRVIAYLDESPTPQTVNTIK